MVAPEFSILMLDLKRPVVAHVVSSSTHTITSLPHYVCLDLSRSRSLAHSRLPQAYLATSSSSPVLLRESGVRAYVVCRGSTDARHRAVPIQLKSFLD